VRAGTRFALGIISTTPLSASSGRRASDPHGFESNRSAPQAVHDGPDLLRVARGEHAQPPFPVSRSHVSLVEQVRVRRAMAGALSTRVTVSPSTRWRAGHERVVRAAQDDHSTPGAQGARELFGGTR